MTTNPSENSNTLDHARRPTRILVVEDNDLAQSTATTPASQQIVRGRRSRRRAKSPCCPGGAQLQLVGHRLANAQLRWHGINTDYPEAAICR